MVRNLFKVFLEEYNWFMFDSFSKVLNYEVRIPSTNSYSPLSPINLAKRFKYQNGKFVGKNKILKYEDYRFPLKLKSPEEVLTCIEISHLIKAFDRYFTMRTIIKLSTGEWKRIPRLLQLISDWTKELVPFPELREFELAFPLITISKLKPEFHLALGLGKGPTLGLFGGTELTYIARKYEKVALDMLVSTWFSAVKPFWWGRTSHYSTDIREGSLPVGPLIRLVTGDDLSEPGLPQIMQNIVYNERTLDLEYLLLISEASRIADRIKESFPEEVSAKLKTGQALTKVEGEKLLNFLRVAATLNFEPGSILTFVESPVELLVYYLLQLGLPWKTWKNSRGLTKLTDEIFLKDTELYFARPVMKVSFDLAGLNLEKELKKALSFVKEPWQSQGQGI